MGNLKSIIVEKPNIIRDKTCIICYEKIKGNCVSCLNCRILTHHSCYFKWTELEYFTKCPMCCQKGNIITSYVKQEIDIDKGHINCNI